MKRRVLAYLLLASWVLVPVSCSMQDVPAGTATRQDEPGHRVAAAESTAEITAATAAVSRTPAATDTSAPTETRTPAPTEMDATAEPVLTLTPTPFVPAVDLQISAENISLFPVPRIYSGDLVSLHIAPTIPPGLAPNDIDLTILVNNVELLRSNVNWRSLNGQAAGLYQWVWDTEDVVGEQVITAVLDPEDLLFLGDENPENNAASVAIQVLPRKNLARAEAEARWLTASNSCCVLHVISNTAAHRDLPDLLASVDEAFSRAAARLNLSLEGPYNVFFVDRVIGQGGFASEEMVVSYLDRDYSNGGLAELLTHEGAHLLTRQIAPESITFLEEGVAVWTAGGHYQQEDLGQRMAALLELGNYIPISEVIDDFYTTQHEISYLEAGSLISYLVETYGWTATRAFYRSTTAAHGLTQSRAVEAGLVRHFGLTLEEVEENWLDYVRDLPRDLEARENLRLTIRYYEVMRHYQREKDPGAYYLDAWLPSPGEAEPLNVTADFVRHPDSHENLALETMLAEAHAALMTGDYERSSAMLDSVSRVLNNRGAFLDPYANAHLGIVRAAAAEGFEVQRIDLDGDQGKAMVTRNSLPKLTELQFELDGQRQWRLAD